MGEQNLTDVTTLHELLLNMY